ncbi:hypothetical protein FFWV33_13135 [Flavobacterium faecale]|uniref:GYF domain-containing protein n=1 Tax=Flavobacterium faecale TaxID=1355330 RepID=A0A2S1LF43_9FLAO|nr:DUF4339 domain-containing protein [Flavobacterium faecale]AWG22400.1 hypothetical protein FFWV33_13135 [Flavobacterium faecale]
MNSYFLHNGTDSIGPFTVEELKTMNLKSSTPIWSQGMPDWTTAAEIAELKPLFTVTPPPIKKIIPAPEPAFSPLVVEAEIIEPVKHKKSKRIFGLNRSVFIFVAFFSVLIIASYCLSLYQDSRREASELKNEQTEKNNVQYRLQQKEIEEQKIQMEIQQKIEADRMLKEKKEMLNAKILANNDLLATANSNFEIAKKKLDEASNFQFFRSEDERYQEIALEQKQVSYWKKEVENIINDTDRIKLELENLH